MSAPSPILEPPTFDSTLSASAADPAISTDRSGASDSSDGRRNRSFFVTWVLSLTLGFLGADRLYTGRLPTGALKLVTLGGLGLWWVIDLVIVMAGGLRYDHRPLAGYDVWKEVAWISTGFLIIVGYSLQLDELIPTLLSQLF